MSAQEHPPHGLLFSLGFGSVVSGGLGLWASVVANYLSFAESGALLGTVTDPWLTWTTSFGAGGLCAFLARRSRARLRSRLCGVAASLICLLGFTVWAWGQSLHLEFSPSRLEQRWTRYHEVPGLGWILLSAEPTDVPQWQLQRILAERGLVDPESEEGDWIVARSLHLGLDLGFADTRRRTTDAWLLVDVLSVYELELVQWTGSAPEATSVWREVLALSSTDPVAALDVLTRHGALDPATVSSLREWHSLEEPGN